MDDDFSFKIESESETGEKEEDLTCKFRSHDMRVRKEGEKFEIDRFNFFILKSKKRWEEADGLVRSH